VRTILHGNAHYFFLAPSSNCLPSLGFALSVLGGYACAARACCAFLVRVICLGVLLVRWAFVVCCCANVACGRCARCVCAGCACVTRTFCACVVSERCARSLGVCVVLSTCA